MPEIKRFSGINRGRISKSYYRKKPPRLGIARATRLEKFKAGFARRLDREKPAESRLKAYDEMERAIRLDREAYEKEIHSIISRPKPLQIETRVKIDAMFRFVKAVETGVIEETDKTRELHGRIMAFSNKLAKALKENKVKYSKKDQRSVYNLLNLLKAKGVPLDEIKELRAEKRGIDHEIGQFIESERQP